MAMLISGCSASSSRSDSGTKPGTSVSGVIKVSKATQVLYAAPVSADGQLIAGLHISGRVDGSCEAGVNNVGTQTAVYNQCTTGTNIFYNCWTAEHSVLPTSAVLCMDIPWDKSAVEIQTSGLPPVQDIPGNLAPDTALEALKEPWGVQLTTGQKCVAFDGSPDRFQGAIVRYNCGFNLWLLNNAILSSPQWTFSTAIYKPKTSSYKSGPRVSVRIAWFPGPES
jgi:hypothetical protein